VTVAIKRLSGSKCAAGVATVGRAGDGIGKYSALQPPSRSCVLPWNLATAEVAGGLGISGVKNDEVERIVVEASGGTFTISHGSEETAPLPFNATAAQLAAALEGLASIGAGNVFVEGGPGGEGGGTPYTIVFIGALAQQAITPLTTNRVSLVADGTGTKLATVIVLRPGGSLDLHRFVLALVEQKEKVALETGEEHGAIPPGAIARIEENIAKNPTVACLDALSAPLPTEGPIATNNEQPFPYYGEVTIE
jgi:hypothetical protein